MTIIIHQPKPATNFLLLKPKRQIRQGDTVIFQFTPVVPNIETGVVPDPTEESVTITDVQEGDGLMKGYQIIVWA